MSFFKAINHAPWFFAVMIVAYEVVIWYIVKGLWALGLWKNQRNINNKGENK